MPDSAVDSEIGFGFEGTEQDRIQIGGMYALCMVGGASAVHGCVVRAVGSRSSYASWKSHLVWTVWWATGRVQLTCVRIPN